MTSRMYDLDALERDGAAAYWAARRPEYSDRKARKEARRRARLYAIAIWVCFLATLALFAFVLYLFLAR